MTQHTPALSKVVSTEKRHIKQVSMVQIWKVQKRLVQKMLVQKNVGSRKVGSEKCWFKKSWFRKCWFRKCWFRKMLVQTPRSEKLIQRSCELLSKHTPHSIVTSARSHVVAHHSPTVHFLFDLG